MYILNSHLYSFHIDLSFFLYVPILLFCILQVWLFCLIHFTQLHYISPLSYFFYSHSIYSTSSLYFSLSLSLFLILLFFFIIFYPLFFSPSDFPFISKSSISFQIHFMKNIDTNTDLWSMWTTYESHTCIEYVQYVYCSQYICMYLKLWKNINC